MTTEKSCSREKSRIARTLVQQLLLGMSGVGRRSSRKRMRRLMDALPEQCLLRPEHDLYYDQEFHKKAMRWNLWRCRYCGKRFVSEYYLDKHLDLKHQSLLNHTLFCPADLCDALDCSAYASLGKTPTSRHKRDAHVASTQRRLSKRRAARLASSCPDDEDLEAKKQRCRVVMGACGFEVAFCDQITCIGGRLIGSPPQFPSDNDNQGRSPGLIVLYLVFLGVYYTLFFLGIRSSPQARPTHYRAPHPPIPFRSSYHRD